ncbi:M14 family zinc carboxypeptidase [Ornithinibacillus salinisoli]|uniref:M14 family zinc carboxypeptidase n=1 Tax=Ornithinibacillus salinisoli TaxID=1848459 RepID=A0ABW4W0G4_9BACI
MKKLLFLLLLVTILTYPNTIYGEEASDNMDEVNSSKQSNDEEILTADEWLEYANSQTTAFSLLDAFIEGYTHYPSDDRFVDGINTSARLLLNWAIRQHQNGELAVAELRYNRILNAPKLIEQLIKETQKKLDYIEKGKKLPTENEIINAANTNSTASGKLQIFSEGYSLYPGSEQLEIWVNNSARMLFNWADRQHQLKKYNTAKTRYEAILDAPVSDAAIRQLTKKYLEYAIENQLAPNHYDVLAKQSNKVSEILNIFLEGYSLYPDNELINEGLQQSTLSLLNWATSQHLKGNVDSAQERYEVILDIPLLEPNVKEMTENKLEFALRGDVLPTIDNIIDKANKNNRASGKLNTYLQGYKLYPHNIQIVEGLNISAQLLFNWADKQHQLRNYDVAIDRYESILNVPVLKEKIQQETEDNLDRALENQLTAKQLYKLADSSLKASEKFALFVEGYELYPEDSLIKDGLSNSVILLLDWATNQHQTGNIITAKVRYERLLQSPILEDILKQETIRKLEFALEGNVLPTEERLIEQILTEGSASRKLSLSIESNKIYPRNKKFGELVHASAINLLDWATNQHQIGNIATARTRYERLLDVPMLDDLIPEVEKKLQFTLDDKILPKENKLLMKIEDSNKASEKLELSIDSYEIYPRNKKFIEAINNSALILLDWTTKQHQLGIIDIAKNRYEAIIKSPKLINSIVKETENKLAYASENKTLPTEKDLITQIDNKNKASEKLEISIKGYELYPRSKQFEDFIHTSAISLLDWATNQHQKGNLETSLSRYEKILSSPILKSILIKEIEMKIEYVEKGKQLPSELDIIAQANHANKISEKLDIYNHGYLLYPRDKRIKNGLNSSAQLLLDWAAKKQQSGNYSTAIDRYNKLINSTGVYNSIKQKANNFLRLARSGKGIYILSKVVNGNVSKYSYNQMIKDIKKLEDQYPYLVKSEIIGKSVEGRNLYAVKLGFGKKEVFLNASQHAREHMTTNVLMKMIDEYAYSYAKGNKFGSYNTKSILDDVSIWFVPMVNPDGVSLVQFGASSASNKAEVIRMNNGSTDFSGWKANIRGVDLNRNFPTNWNYVQNNPGKPSPTNFKGYNPLSEPESKALYEFTIAHNFKTEVDYHSSGEILYFGDDLLGINNSLLAISKRIAQQVSTKTGYPLYYTRGIPGGGRRADWSQQILGRPVLTPEISPYVGNRPVPVSYFNSIWKKNDTIGLLIADEARNR